MVPPSVRHIQADRGQNLRIPDPYTDIAVDQIDVPVVSITQWCIRCGIEAAVGIARLEPEGSSVIDVPLSTPMFLGVVSLR